MEEIVFFGPGGFEANSGTPKSPVFAIFRRFFACEIINNVTKNKKCGRFYFYIAKMRP